MPEPVGISASTAAAILGVSEYQTQTEGFQRLMERMYPGWNERHGYALEPVEYNAQMRWGHAFEDAIIWLRERETDAVIIDREAPYESRYENGMLLSCHVDGVYLSSTDTINDSLHEGKTTFERAYRAKWGEPGTDRVPRDYQVQVQHQMLVSGYESAVVSVLVWPRAVTEWEEMGIYPGSVPDDVTPPEGIVSRAIYPHEWARVLSEMGYFHRYYVDADPETQRTLVEAYTDFWNRYVLTGTPPPPDTYADVRRLFPHPVGTLVADEQIERWCREYSEIGKEIGKSGRLGKRREELKTLVLDWARQQHEYALDDDSQEKVVIRDGSGSKLAQFDGKTFR